MILHLHCDQSHSHSHWFLYHPFDPNAFTHISFLSSLPPLYFPSSQSFPSVTFLPPNPSPTSHSLLHFPIPSLAEKPLRFDGVLMDLRMPVMDGIEATRYALCRVSLFPSSTILYSTLLIVARVLQWMLSAPYPILSNVIFSHLPYVLSLLWTCPSLYPSLTPYLPHSATHLPIHPSIYSSGT